MQITPEAYLQGMQHLLHTSPHHELWHKDAQGTWHQIEGYPLITAQASDLCDFYYEQGDRPETIRKVSDRPYVFTHSLSELFLNISKEFSVDIFSITLDQWTFSPDVKES